jgi:ankyrin repeat protein
MSIKQLLFIILLQGVLSMQIMAQGRRDQVNAASLNLELIDAVANGYYSKAADLLIKHANANTYTEEGLTPLLYAAYRNDIRMAQLLLEYSADPNAKAGTDRKELPLLVACQRGFGKMVELLIKNGANVNQANFYGVTPLHYASFYNDSAILMQLLEKDANLNVKTSAGETPLLYAAFNGSLLATDVLLQMGADPNLADISGYTPLMAASQNGHTDVVFALMGGNASINARNNKGFSALSYAIIHKQNDVADLLLLNGANKNETNTLSLNPLALAKISQNKPVVDSLRRAKAKRNFLPNFKYAGSVGFDFRFNNKDFLTGIVISPVDIKFNLEYSLFYYLRPFAVPVLQGGAGNTFYQYWERRHIIGLSLAKRFRIWESSNQAFLLFGGGMYEYHFGRYRGTTINNTGGLLLSPCAGAIYTYKRLDFRLSAQYTRYATTGLPNWYIGCGIRWNYQRKLQPRKVIYLIDYK